MRGHRRVLQSIIAAAAIFLLLLQLNGRQNSTDAGHEASTNSGNSAATGHVQKPANGASGLKGEARFDWARRPLHNPVSSIRPLPTSHYALPRIQYNFPPSTQATRSRQQKRRQAVRDAFKKCWRSYREHAWTKDELMPLSGGGKNTFGGWAVTMVDALDSLWLMDLKAEFAEAVKAVADIDWSTTYDTSCSVFETTIRHLGGLLSAYELSGEKVLLTKAVELGDMLYAAFDTPNRTPVAYLNFEKAKKGGLDAEDRVASANIGSLSLEFTKLAQITGNDKYYDAVARVSDYLSSLQNSTQLPGLFPVYVNLRDGLFTERTFTLGALTDSLYEYFPKMHALLGGGDQVYEKLWRDSMSVIHSRLLYRPMLPDKADILFSGQASVDYFNNHRVILTPEAQHLSCFVGGAVALGGRLFDNQTHVDLGARLARGCIYAYNAYPHGIMPEVIRTTSCPSLEPCEWDEKRWAKASNTSPYGSSSSSRKAKIPKGFTETRDGRYLLRPEAIESVFVLYRITGDQDLQDAAWKMFKNIQAATETPYGNAAIVDVTANHVRLEDSMESFWLGETLKYFWLIFEEPDVLSLDEWVLNTEAHPFRIMKPSASRGRAELH